MTTEFKTPAELIGKLKEYEDAETAAQVYAEATDMERQYTEVQEHAKAMAEALLPRGSKINIGVASAGWTQPRTRWVLDEEAWQQACEKNQELASLAASLQAAKQAYESASKAVEEAQTHYQKEQAPPSRFFIKINPPKPTA